LWVNPLLSLILPNNRSLLRLWLIICTLTGLIYPILYQDFSFLPTLTGPDYLLLLPAVVTRNILLIVFTLQLFRYHLVKNFTHGDHTAQA
jgi:hypothetical protein